MCFKIVGGKRLSGELKVQGAKNSILPILAACVLCRGEVLLHNCPQLSDVDSAIKILKHLGLSVEHSGSDIAIKCGGITNCEVPSNLMREMRSSVVFLGAILAASGCAKVSMPGGCELGPRPIDMHLSALKRLGAEIVDECGTLYCSVRDGLVGNEISLYFPSVGATENSILASVTAKGTTTIMGAAREPEIEDLANFLNACGAKIYGAGTSKITVEGVSHLKFCEYSIMPDRIASVTYLAAAAMTRGDITLKNAQREHITSVLSLFEQTGCALSGNENSIRLISNGRLQPMHIIKTLPYPGFPTDAQAPMMALSCLCNGTTMFVETIFENRFRHIDELKRMGADIKSDGRVAVVTGKKTLNGASVKCTDLRGGAAMVLASLAAHGESEISAIEHIDRGYQHIEKDFSSLGADMVRKII